MPARALIATVWLDAQARAAIAAEAISRPRTETGGALFGYAQGGDVVVACAYGPGPRAKHRRTTFEPHAATTQMLIDAVYDGSDARYRYLGSWHSHPLGVPRPSGTDIRTSEDVAHDTAVALPEPLVLIQATRRAAGSAVEPGELRAWRWSARERWLMPCELEPVELAERYCPVVCVRPGRLRRDVAMTPGPA